MSPRRGAIISSRPSIAADADSVPPLPGGGLVPIQRSAAILVHGGEERFARPQ